MTTKFNATLNKLAAETDAFQQAYGMNLINTAKALFAKKRPDAQILKILPKLYEAMAATYPNPATLSVKLSEVRKVIKANQSEDVGRKSNQSAYFNLPADARNALRSAYEAKVKKSNTNLTQVSVNNLRDGLITLAERSRTDPSSSPRAQASAIYYLGVLLMLGSGMRPVELFQNDVVATDERHAKFGRLAKKRPGATASLSVERPIIGQTSDEFVRRLSEFRQHFAPGSAHTQAAAINRGLNQAARAVFPELINSPSASSMMRKYYTVLAYELYADKEHTNFNHYIQGLLGHDSVGTSFAYSTINLTGTTAEGEEAKNLDVDRLPRRSGAGLAEGAGRPTFSKISRRAPIADKIALLDQIYRADPQISNSELRRISGCGSRIVNDFLREFATVIDAAAVAAGS
jgi:integrase